MVIICYTIDQEWNTDYHRIVLLGISSPAISCRMLKYLEENLRDAQSGGALAYRVVNLLYSLINSYTKLIVNLHKRVGLAQ